MGSFVFKWTHPANEVYVTGTFDSWSKSEKLEKVGDIFEKEVDLEDAHTSKKIYYKFVVDGNWTTDHTAPQENDENGNLNNFLTPERIIKPSIADEIMSGVTPQSTTAELAKSVPLEQTGSAALPGTFPETPGLETPGVAPKEFSVNPIPASDGVGNPIKLAAGEKVPAPSEINTNTIESSVTLDKESYEHGSSAPVLPDVITPDSERAQNGTGVFDLPPISKNMIPESSLPISSGADEVTPFIQSAAPMSSTAQLAAAVPLESSKVPESVVESQKEAGFPAEASAVPEEVKEKSEVEKELLKEVPEVPATSEGTAGQGTDKSEDTTSPAEVAAGVGGAAVAAGGAAAAAAYAAKDKVSEAVNGSAAPTTAADSAPEVVKESITESGQGPEAAAYTEPIAEKAAVEKELLAEVKTSEATGESAPKIIEPETTPALETPAIPDSRDISPSTVPGTHAQTIPEVTTGVGASTVPAVSGPSSSEAAKEVPGSSSTASTPAKSSVVDKSKEPVVADKKKKRRSFFGRLTDKLSGHKKEKATS